MYEVKECKNIHGYKEWVVDINEESHMVFDTQEEARRFAKALEISDALSYETKESTEYFLSLIRWLYIKGSIKKDDLAKFCYTKLLDYSSLKGSRGVQFMHIIKGVSHLIDME